MAATGALHRISQSAFVDAFLLREAERTVVSYPATRADAMRSFFKAADQRTRAVDELIESQTVAAVPLLREAALLYMAALAAVTPGAILQEPLRAEEVVKQFDGMEKRVPCPRSATELAEFLELLADYDPFAIDRLASDEALDRVRGMRDIVAWLRELNEPRSLREIKVQRVVRVGLLTAVLLGGLFWGVSALFKPTNIALNKPVEASSVFPGATVVPSALVDGSTSGTYAVHTNREEYPWAQVDLTATYAIDKIKVYNRGDGWFDEGLPMTLQFSEDGVTFTDVDTRSKSFGQWSPWTFNAGKKRTRFIRVRGNRGSYVSLAEIEVFGKK